MTRSNLSSGRGRARGELHRFKVQRIPPSHDYIRRHGTGPKDGWARGPADPGPVPHSAELDMPDKPGSTGEPAPATPEAHHYGAIHKFGYTRPLKKHEQPPAGCAPRSGATAVDASAQALDVADPSGDTFSDTPPFVHLHVHSNFSFLDGGSRIEELVARTAELGQPALALTDHDGLYGAVRFAKACAKHGIKPIFGAEVRVESLLTAGLAADEPKSACTAPATVVGGATSDDPHHLVLLAETREGYANLCRLLSAAHLADPQRERPPVVTIESLCAHAQGLICLTACRHGEVGHLIDAGRFDDALNALLRLRDIFGPHNLYLELQYFGYEPHQEAHAGQHGSSVYQKIRTDGGRLRHRSASDQRAELTDPATPTVASPSSSPASSAPISGPTDLPVLTSPFPLGATTATDSHFDPMRNRCNATTVASWQAFPTTDSVENSPGFNPSAFRPDLPEGHPQRLNPSDYDVGFHRNGYPWRLSCLTYCLHLTHLARTCNLPTVLTVNVHYAGESDRAIHLICRAAGHDQPLSDYPEAVPGFRCLKSLVSLESLVSPLVKFLGSFNEAASSFLCCGRMQNSGDAAIVALMGGGDEIAAPPPPVATDSRRVVDPSPVVDPGPFADQSAAASLSPLATPWAIAQRCNVDLDLGVFHFPKVDVPPGETAYSLLAKRCFRGIARKYKPVPPQAVALLEKELRMIQEMGFAHYFLVVHDIVRWARAKGIACSGRGSAGNSIVCHALDITASEPIRHNLLFERFLNPNRREMPDIDVDFCSSRRDEVIEHIYQTFGEKNVAVVANVNTMSPRSAVRIVAEALGFAPTEINALAKNVPRHGDAARIREYLAGAWPELRDSPLQDGAHAVPATPPGPDGTSGARPGTPGQGVPERPEGRFAHFLDLVERLDSFPLHLGTHLGGFVIADREIPFYAPLQWAAKRLPVRNASPPGGDRREGAKDAGSVRSSATGATENVGSLRPAQTRRPGRSSQATSTKGVVVLQFNKDDVAALGLVKMDILGLRTHSAVSETVHLVRQRTGRRIRPYDLPPDDPAAYEIISNGGSIGLFQLESAGQRNLASRLQERDFDDVIAAIALYRPGPLEAEMIGPFIDRRWGIEPVSLPHPAMAEAVADTYGVILYQEQVLRIAQSVAGFDLADADSLRRAMTRDRSREEMAKIGETFIARAVSRGVPEEAAREVFRQLEGFAAYGFNKSHSVCFAVISYATAYLKAYYPAEFLCAVLNNYPMGFYTPRTVLNDARRFGLEVRPLDINLSGRGFTVEDETAPDVWDTSGAAGDDLAARGAPTEAVSGTAGAGGDIAITHPLGAQIPYDPFAQAWTAEHHWGLTEADLAEFAAEQEGKQAYAEALRAALEQKHAAEHTGEPHRASGGIPSEGATHGANPGPVSTGDFDDGAASPSGGSEPPRDGGAASAVGRETPPPPEGAVPAVGLLSPGDLLLPRAPRARGGVEPGACLAPSTGITPDAARALRVGFSYLKQMGERSLDRIEEERRHGPFESFEDFYLRTRLDYPVAENLIRVGAFDSLEPDRTELLWRLPILHDRLEALAGSSGQRRGQLRAFFSPPSRAGLERTWTLEDKVRAELELLGLTVSCHPLQLYEEELRRMGVRMSYELPGMGDEVPVTVAGVYERAQNPWMRSGRRTMFLTLEDAYGLFECVCFESKLAKIAPVVARASYFLVRGRLQNNHKRGLAIVAEEVLDLEEVLARRRAKQAVTTTDTTTATTGTAARDDGRSRRGHPESRRMGQVMQGSDSSSREMPPIPNAIEMLNRREEETYGDGTVSAKKRPPGAGTGAIPKKVG